MSRIPGSSYSMLAFYLFLTALGCFLIGGILPMVVILVGLAMTIRRSDFRYMRNAGRFIAWFYGAASVTCLLVAASHIASLSAPGLQSLTVVEHQYFVRFFGMACLINAFGWALTKHALLPAFQPYSRAIAAHGFWGNRNGDAASRNRLAAELVKWTDIRKDGAVAEADVVDGKHVTGAAA